MKTENKGNKTPEEYIEQHAHKRGVSILVGKGIALHAVELARTQEREKLIREAVIEVMKIKGSSTLELSIHSAVIEILNNLKGE